MAKKFVRGVTGVEDIESFDKSLTNVNDLVSDGQDTYVHTKKGKTESYYKLTDSVKTIESSGNTITVEKDENGTVKLDTNPKKVLEHENLSVDYGISKSTLGNITTLGIVCTKVSTGFNLDTLVNGRVRGYSLLNAPSNDWYLVTGFSEGNNIYQEAIALLHVNNKKYVRMRDKGVWTQWREQVGDKSVIDELLTQKQNTIISNTSIGVVGTGLRQLYNGKTTYTATDGYLQTHYKSVAPNTNPNAPEEEFNFIVKINKNISSVTFNLNSRDAGKFRAEVTKYGSNNTVRISGCVFTLSGSTLTVSTANNTEQNYVITFSDII